MPYASLVFATAAVLLAATMPPQAAGVGKLEPVAKFTGAMPTGVTVSKAGRIFVNFPRWGDPTEITVAEVKGGKPVAFPPGLSQQVAPDNGKKGLVSVQSVVVDPADRLWILDTGSIKFGPTHPGGPKLVCVDLGSNKVTRTIAFPPDVALPGSYLNDVRFDLARKRAYITDSAAGANGIVVVNLADGSSWRRLSDHPSVKAWSHFTPLVEGKPLVTWPKGGKPGPLTMGSDGIAIAPDGRTLYYCPLASRRLWSVDATLLADRNKSDAQVAASVRDLGAKPASDGLESDDAGRLYATDYEGPSLQRRKPDGKWETLVADKRLMWPDTLSLAADGHLYVMANQLHRQAGYHDGHDLRVKPYVLYRLAVGARPAAPN